MRFSLVGGAIRVKGLVWWEERSVHSLQLDLVGENMESAVRV